MKKFVVFVCLLFASFAGYAQQNETAPENIEYASSNIGGFVFGNYCFQDKSASEGISASLMIYQNIVCDLQFRGSIIMTMFTAPENEQTLSFGAGLEYPLYKNFYCYAEIFLSTFFCNVEYQVYGYRMTVYFPVDLGIGYVLFDKNNHSIYIEAFVEKEFTVYYEFDEMKRNGVNAGITLGYSYTFVKNIR